MKKLIVNGKIITMDISHPSAEAVLFEGERIIAVGNSSNLKSTYSVNNKDIFDAKGAVIVPGFIDAHNHYTLMGVQKFELDLGGIFNREMILNRIHEEHLKLDPNLPLIGINYEVDHIPKEHHIYKFDLQKAAPNRIIQISDRSSHMSVTTDQTLQVAEINLDPKECLQCMVPCNLKIAGFTGEICGLANSALHHYVQKGLRNPETLKSAWKYASSIAAEHGVTSIHAIVTEEEMKGLIYYKDILPIDLKIYTETKNVKAVKAAGLKQIGGCGAVMVDGDSGPFTAAFLEPYTERPETSGLLYYSDEELEDFVWEVHSAGLQLALHCVGDAASQQVLNAVEAVQNRSGRKIRHRIEHFEFGTKEQMDKVKRLGMCLSIQPNFNHFWNHTTYIEQLGISRAMRADPIQTIAKKGIPMGFGSDCAVTPCDPLLTISSAVNHSLPDERISPTNALYFHTIGSAYIGMEEKDKGSITPGKFADMVLLDADPTEVDSSEIKDIPVKMTIAKGHVIYSQ
jgi:predicted amidohydrolase YtcJ